MAHVPTSSVRRTVQAGPRAFRSQARRLGLGVAVSVVTAVVIGAMWTPSASAATAVQLGTAAPFAVLAGEAVTNVPTSSITGDVGLSPAAGSFYAGLTAAEVTGTIYATDATGPAGSVNDPALLTTAKNDLTTAFTSADGQPATTTFAAGDNQLGGQTLTAGVYAFGHASTANITAASPLVLDGQGDVNSVFVFQASSDLITASGSVVQLVNGAQACNVFWVVDSSATLGSSSTFVGTLMALTSATLNSAATVQGRILARNAAVSLDNNTIVAPTSCAVTSTTTAGSTTATTTAGGSGVSSTSAAAGTGAPTAGSGTSSSTGAATGVVPVGFPHTGEGGASRSRDSGLIALGILALAGSGTSAAIAARRRVLLARSGKRTPE